VLKDEAVQFRRAETYIVKSLLKGEPISLSLAHSGIKLRRSPPEKIIMVPESSRVFSILFYVLASRTDKNVAEEKKNMGLPAAGGNVLVSSSTTSSSTSSSATTDDVPPVRCPSPQRTGFERRVTVSAMDKSKSPRGQPDLIPPKRMITIGSRQQSKMSHSSDDIDVIRSSINSSPRYVSSVDIRSPGLQSSTANKSVHRRLFEDATEVLLYCFFIIIAKVLKSNNYNFSKGTNEKCNCGVSSEDSVV